MDLPELACSSTGGGEAKAIPYADVFVALSKQEHMGLVCAANYWKMEHRRAAERALSIEALLGKLRKALFYLAPRRGFEPRTCGLTVLILVSKAVRGVPALHK